ncbi:hypothetical protein [Streptomyces luteireticuli]|uniref:hypothetical protein n=1 Tax=Streptomyces luteireticuli TaxID=173858 RepID=UPI003556A68A
MNHPKPGAAPVQPGSHFFIITLEQPGRETYTTHGAFTPPPGSTRHDAFLAILAIVVRSVPSMQGANVTFFSLEPNQL